VQIIPAIDLKDNKCVRLSEGIDESSEVFNNDPEEQAIHFQKNGCKKLHIVDLDAAFGRRDINFPSIEKIRKSISIPIQLGGGIGSADEAKKYFDIGIENLIIGSMSVNKPEEVKLLSNIYKKRIYVSLDVKDDQIMIRGWKEKSSLDLERLLEIYNDSYIKGYVITDIKNDGMLRGLNTEFIKKINKTIELKNNSNKTTILAGGLTSYEDLKNLNNLKLKNVEGIISGKSFYVGNIDLKKAQQILNQNG